MLAPRPQQPLANHGYCGAEELPVSEESLATRNPATLGTILFVDHEEYLRQLQRQKDNLSVVLVDRLLMQGEARNLALRDVHERLCVVLENDTIVHANWLTPMLACMREERAAVVTP
jgi:hypothetical protein